MKDSLLGITEGVMNKLMDFEDTQAALFLLRLSFGIVRATHFMRTIPSPSGPGLVPQFSIVLASPVDEAYGLAIDVL